MWNALAPSANPNTSVNTILIQSLIPQRGSHTIGPMILNNASIRHLIWRTCKGTSRPPSLQACCSASKWKTRRTPEEYGWHADQCRQIAGMLEDELARRILPEVSDGFLEIADCSYRSPKLVGLPLRYARRRNCTSPAWVWPLSAFGWIVQIQ
jgi:hypothetical protein